MLSNRRSPQTQHVQDDMHTGKKCQLRLHPSLSCSKLSSHGVLKTCRTIECSTAFFLGPCRGRSCDFNAECVAMRDGTALCRCPERCFAVPKPVCGSDGQTYKDECEMKRVSCIKKQPITAVNQGECRMYFEGLFFLQYQYEITVLYFVL